MNTEQIVQDEVENFAIKSQWLLLDDPLLHAIRKAIKREREACALVAEYEAAKRSESRELCEFIAAAIRARGNK